MTSAYYVKTYCSKKDQPQEQPEIRRFAINIAPDNDVYSELTTKIASFQSDNQYKDFTLQYNDEENERITFSSNDELRSAIALNKDGNTLKVFVTLYQSIPQQQQQPAQEDTTDKECHVGVECDGCQGPVIGFRYKCFVCPNYDLCEKCSAAGIHSEHNMIKITKPGNFHYPHEHHHHQQQHHMTPPPFVPNQHFLQHIQSQIPQWLPNREKTAHFRNHMQQHIESIKANTQSHVQNSKQYLESVGQYLQQALSPFGIDCDYLVEEHKSTENQQQQQQQEQPTQEQEQEQEILTTEVIPTPEPSAVPKYPTLLETTDHQEQTANTSIPVVVESTRIRTPLEKGIDDCMEQMQAMGFMDATGEIYELVVAKQGNINAVLDAMNSRYQ